ncbi:cell growth regulator with EF hand domain protein 1 [Tamandua tetradactyla]|uniref:cell growth regulator with EF hand domain protein 1 n=1 Tax=Tamandua tetradactyla TaxID=48850 RepID=UPI0040545C7C
MAPLMVRMLVLLLLLPPLGQAAPKDGALRLAPDAWHQPLPNPFQPSAEQLRLLQGYLKGLERMEEEPERMSREQVVLYLFALHDYDQSGQLDGLELLSMLTAALAPGAADSPTSNPVVPVVDEVLATQDLNGDGLMTPAELVNYPGEAPRHAEPKEPPASAPREPQAVETQRLLAEGPLGQETQESLSPREEVGGQVEARREILESAQEAGRQAEAQREAPGPGAEAWRQAEAQREALSPEGEAWGQAEALDTGEEAEELPGEMLESKNHQNELEIHAIQVEYDEM